MTRADTKSLVQQVSPPKFPGLIVEKQEARPVETQVGLGAEKTVSYGPGVNPSSWEDSPKRVVETSGILNPPVEARKQVPIILDSALVKPVSVPPPFAKVSAPPGVIVGPGVSPLSPRKPSLKSSPLLPLSKANPMALLTPPSQGSRPPPTPVQAIPAQPKPFDVESKPSDEKTSTSEEAEPESSKPTGRPRPQIKKRFSF